MPVRRPEHHFLLCSAALLTGAAAFLSAPADAQNRGQDIRTSLQQEQALDAKERQKAGVLSSALEDQQKKLAAAADAVRTEEERLAALNRTIAGLARQEQDMAGALDQKRRDIAHVLAAFQRLAMRPPETMLVSPTPPNDMVRSAILLRAAIPNLEQSVSSLRHDLDAMAQTRAELDSRIRQQQDTARTLEEERYRLAVLHDETDNRLRTLTRKNQERNDRIRRLAEQASGIQDLITRLQQDDQGAPAAANPDPPAAADTPPPSSGREPLLQHRTPLLTGTARRLTDFGQTDETGSPSHGATLSSVPQAQVLAPVNGTVVFAGPFRGYGLLLIIEHGEGYHTLLSGMSHLSATAGQTVQAGDAVGVMGDESESPRLYVELRQHGQPVAPTPWLPPGKKKVSE